MKTKTLLLLLFLAFFCSCGDSDDSSESKKSIEITEKKVYLWEGEETDTEVKTILTHPTIKVEDASIAKAEFINNKIHITSYKRGSTNIYISDNNHKETSFFVIVGSIQGTYTEWSSNTGEYIYNVEVLAENHAIVSSIRNELTNSLKNNIGTPYQFNDNDNNFSITRLDVDKNVTVLIGTYEYDDVKSILTLKHSGITEIFNVYPLNYYLVKLEQDLTLKYKTEYSDAQISKVLVTKYILKPRNL